MSRYLFSKYFKTYCLSGIWNKNSSLEDKIKDSPEHLYYSPCFPCLTCSALFVSLKPAKCNIKWQQYVHHVIAIKLATKDRPFVWPSWNFVLSSRGCHVPKVVFMLVKAYVKCEKMEKSLEKMCCSVFTKNGQVVDYY